MRGNVEFPPFSFRSDGGIQAERKTIEAWLVFPPLQFSTSLESLFPKDRSGAAFFQPGVVLIGFCLKYLQDGNIRDEPLSL